MTQVWLVRYDQGLYLFKDLETVQVSIRDMYPTDYQVEKEEMSDQAVVYQIMHNDRVQDRIAAGLFDVHEQPIVIHRSITNDDPVPEKRREEF